MVTTIDEPETLKYYAVAKGRDIGIFFIKQKHFVEVVKPLVNRFRGNAHESFTTELEAVNYMKEHGLVEFKIFDNGLNVLKAMTGSTTSSNRAEDTDSLNIEINVPQAIMDNGNASLPMPSANPLPNSGKAKICTKGNKPQPISNEPRVWIDCDKCGHWYEASCINVILPEDPEEIAKLKYECRLCKIESKMADYEVLKTKNEELQREVQSLRKETENMKTQIEQINATPNSLNLAKAQIEIDNDKPNSTKVSESKKT